MFLFSPTDYHHEAPYPIVAADDESSMSAYWFCIPQIRSIKLKGDFTTYSNLLDIGICLLVWVRGTHEGSESNSMQWD